MTNKELLFKCRNGDRKAQKFFYNKYVNLLKKYSLQYTKDAHRAKDVVQESFIRIFNNLDKIDEEKNSLVPWMIKIVINEAIRLKGKIRINIDTSEKVTDYDDVMITEALNNLELQDLMNIIGRLSYNEKVVFLLKEVEGYSHKEISKLLSIAESSSRTLLTRSKQRLRKLIPLNNFIPSQIVKNHE